MEKARAIWTEDSAAYYPDINIYGAEPFFLNIGPGKTGMPILSQLWAILSNALKFCQ